ncbi:hypothetical protein [Pedobacter nyackensis]|uniref:hypothetical protein n=1 Tax=Pedobacter nyackensis TaxID=475255 RepID=UPI0029303072|nr:hypothetical protein [Pedobacter nyackensis]
MKTEMTTTLRNLVVNDLQPATKALTLPKINKWLKELPGIADGLFQLMSTLVFSPLSEQLVNRHIRQIQHESICLMNILQSYQKVPAKMLPLHKAVLGILEAVLEHIEAHYPAHFNLDLAVPDTHFKLAVTAVEEKMSFMLNRLKSKSNDKTLQKLIHDSLLDFTTAQKCSYYRLAYIKSLQVSVTELCEDMEREEGDEKLKELLIYLNLNTAAHVKYYKKNINTELAGIFDLQEQDELLYAYQKQIKSINPQRNTGFTPFQDSIKTTLLNYIRAEIKYREKIRPAASADPYQRIGGIWPMPPDPYKIQVSFSVDALAYFFKLMIRVGLVNGTPKTQLLQFISKSFKTVAMDSISTTSLSRKYDQVVQTTAKAVRVVLLRMLKILDEEFKLF